MKKFLKSIAEGVAMAFFLVLGILLAVASFIWYFIPKWKKEEDRDIEQRVQNMKATLAESHAARDGEVKAAVAEVEKKAESLKAADTVDIANDLILKG